MARPFRAVWLYLRVAFLMLMLSVHCFARIALASYYAAKFAGRRTANGEKYDPNKNTAAHHWYPFGTRLRLTNLANGKTVLVVVNDRKPLANNRYELDLSDAAAKILGMKHAGWARVELEVLRDK